MKSIVIASNALRRFYRDRTAVFFTILLPVVIIFVVGNATARFDDPTFPVGIVDAGSGPFGAELGRRIQSHDSIDLRRVGTREELAKLVRRGAVVAGLVVPDGYDAELRSGSTATVELLVDQTRPFPAAVRSLAAGSIAAQGGELQAASFASRSAGIPFEAALSEARRTDELLEGVSVGVRTEVVGQAGERDYLPPGIGYQTPSNLVLFVFITSMAGAALLIQSRQLRVTHRMFGTPTAARTILGGEALARFAIAGAQALIILLVGTLLFRVDWGAPAGAAAIIVLFVAVGTASGMLVGTLFRTPEQAGAIGPVVGIIAGMLGGCMWPLEIVPDAMRVAGHILPHAWAMDAWIELIGRGGGIADIAVELAVLAGFVAVLFPLATRRLRRALTA